MLKLCVPVDTVLKGCPNLGPPLSYPLQVVQSDVKRFGICSL